MPFGALGVMPMIATMRKLTASTENARVPLVAAKREAPAANETDSSTTENIPSARNSNQKKVMAPRSTSAT